MTSTDAASEWGSGAGDKGLKKNAIGFVSNVVIGVASTAPGYSLAAVLGFIVAIEGIGNAAPAIMIVAFVPMLFIAAAYYYMNRADPDCGTTFTWVTRAMGPWFGWMGGWGIACAGTIVMANLAEIAGLYSFYLFGDTDPPLWAVTAVGVAFIIVMTWICVIGVELSARTQVGLLGAEVITLAIFAVVALVKVWTGNAGEHAISPALSWFNPFEIDSVSALVAGMVLATFIYWGWDSTVTVNEESTDSATTPGKAAVLATVILVVIYVVVATAAQAFDGPQAMTDPKTGEGLDDALGELATAVMGSPWDKLVIIAILTSAAASCQTTILPNARTALSMARQGAFPRLFGDIHPRYLSPHKSTIAFGVLSVIWYVGMTIISQNLLYDSIAALGLMIAFYYGLTGIACVLYYRRELTNSVRNFVMVGIAPLTGSVMLFGLFIKSCADLANPKDASSGAVFGVGAPLVMGLGFLLTGLIIMIVWNLAGSPRFFKRRPETAKSGALERPPETEATTLKEA